MELPELHKVAVVQKEGLLVHDFDQLLIHLERHFDPDIRNNILYFYLTGSRLYGTDTEESDWDYVCVTKHETKEARKSSASLRNGDEAQMASKPFLLKESNVYDIDATLELYGLPLTNVPKELRFDVSFFDLRTWKTFAFEQNIIAIEGQCIPKEYILFKSNDFPTFKIDPPVLKTTTCLLGGLKFANSRARLLDKPPNYIKAKKLGALGIRYLQFGIQLLESYRDTGVASINNWKSIEPIWNNLFLTTDVSNYDDFEEKFRPTFKALDTQVRQIMLFDTLYTVREKWIARFDACKATFTKLKSDGFFDECKYDKIENGDLSKQEELALVGTNDTGLSSFKDSLLSELKIKGFLNLASSYAIFPSKSVTQPSLVSLFVSCHSPITSLPHLQAIHGTILDISDNFKIIAQGPGKLIDLSEVLINDNTPVISHLSNLLSSDDIHVEEHLDGHGVLMYYYKNSWRISTYGGNVDGKEWIGTRTTEGKGPQKTTIHDQFWKIWKQLEYVYPPDTSKSYLFELITATSRHVTAYTPKERIVFLGSSSESAITFSNTCSTPVNWEMVNTYPDITESLLKISSLSERLQLLIDFSAKLNPFETSGYVIKRSRYQNGDQLWAAKMISKGMWSIKASVGHQNRVLAFNVGGDHFENESLSDVSIYGYSRPFLAHFPNWRPALESAAMEVRELASWLEAKSRSHFVHPNRKELAISLKDTESPLKSVILDYYSYSCISGMDLLPSLEIKYVRLFKKIKEQS